MLSISITSNKDQAFIRQISIAEKATIGRNPASDIYLPDPDKHISRLHALIEYKDGDYHLFVASKTNAVSVNDRPYPHGSTIKLAEGDRIDIHSYMLTATALTRPAASSKVQTASAFDTLLATPSPQPWTDATVPSNWSNDADPFGLSDLMRPPPAKPPAGPDPFAMLTPARHGLAQDLAPLAAENDSALLDPIQALNQRGMHNPLNISGNPASASPFDDILKPLWPSAPQSPFGAAQSGSPLVDFGGHQPAGTPSLQHVHDFNLPFTPPPPQEQRAPAANPAVETAWHPQPAPAPEMLWPSQTAGYPAASPASLWPSQTQPAAATTTGAATPAHIAGGNEQLEWLLNTFCKAAGLEKPVMTAEETAAYVESIGAILRTSIDGIYSLIKSRSMLKGEFGAEDRTMVATRDNNPLKYMHDTDEVMQFLFENKKLSSMYLPPVQSVQGACNDLMLHDYASTAGLQAAIEGSIRHFNPQLIEAALDKSGKKMILNRKAALWETYVERYHKMEESMADQVTGIIDRDFARAYDKQMRKMKQ